MVTDLDKVGNVDCAVSDTNNDNDNDRGGDDNIA